MLDLYPVLRPMTFRLPLRDAKNADAAGVSADARDRVWAAAIRAGDASAFEALFRAYKNDLVAFVTSIVNSRETAQEIVQDLFLRIWQQRELWEVSGAVNTYLFRAARNRAINHLRHQRIETRFQERITQGSRADLHGSPPGPTDERAHVSDMAAAVERAVNDLPDRCREVFRLRRYHHLSNAETAAVLDIAVSTVEVQMTRAISFLRKRLASFRD